MSQATDAIIIEAIYSDGVLRPVTPLDLPNDQRVKVIVQAVPAIHPSDRAEALQQLFEDIDRADLHLKGPLPSREELHERSL